MPSEPAKAQRKQQPALRGALCLIPPHTTSLRSINNCSVIGTFYASELNIPDREFTVGFPGVTERTEWFAIDFAGRFSVGKSGRYSFRIASDDGSLVWIDNKMVVDNDGAHRVRSKQGSIQLAAGVHRIRVFYFQAQGNIALQLFATPPGGQEALWRESI